MLRAVKKVHGPVALVHFDAHLDTWPTYFGAPYTHGTPFRRAAEEGLFVPGRSAHVGIRGSLYGTSDLTEDAVLGFQMFNCLDIDRVGVTAIIEQLRDQVGDLPTYLSIDIDVLDPAFAPGPARPSRRGSTVASSWRSFGDSRERTSWAATSSRSRPPTTTQRSPAIAAANLVYEYVSLFEALASR